MLKISHSIENFSSSHAETRQTESYLVFTVDNEEFGIEAQRVLELVKYIPPLKMPNNFVNVQGMSIFRGKLIPIVDLRMIFGINPVAANDNWVTIIVESSVSVFGIIAERVSDLVSIPVNSIKKVTAFNYGEKLKYLKSVANYGEKMILLLDLEKIVENKPAPVTNQGVSNSQTAAPNPELPKPPKEGSDQIIQPTTSGAEPKLSSSCLIDPKELEDLLAQSSSKPEPQAEAHFEKETELNESDLPDIPDNDDPHSGIIEDFQSLKIEANQNDLTLGFLDKAEDFFNPEPQPAVETGPLILSKEKDLAIENNRLSTGLVNPAELEALLIELEQEKDAENVSNPDQTQQDCLSEDMIEDILKELEAESQPVLKEPTSNNNQNQQLGRIKAPEEKPDV